MRFSLRAFGQSCEIDVDTAGDPELEAALRSAWRDFAAPVPSTRLVPSGVGVGDRLADLTEQLTAHLLGQAPSDHLLFHACAVADPSGRVLAFSGPSGAGKTTLTSVLLASAWTPRYVTDEALAVGPGQRVATYRKPLSVRRDPDRAKHQVPASTISPATADDEKEFRLRALCWIDRDPSARTPKVTTVPLTEAVLRLVPQMSFLRSRTRPLQTLADLLDRAGGLRLVSYAEARDVRDLLTDLLADPPTTTGPPQEWSPARHDGPRTRHIVDALAVADDTIVFDGEQVQHLQGVGSTIWRAVAADADPVAAVAAHGPLPPGMTLRTAVEDRIGQLVDLHLLES